MEFKNSIFKFVDIKDEYALQNIEKRELICRYFDDFNDPYESHYGVKAVWPDPYKETENLTRLISRMEPEEYTAHINSVRSMIEYIRSHSNLRDYTLDMIYKATKRFRVCSFTRRWNHILMWSHYARGCRSVALIFNQNEILNGESAREVGSDLGIDAEHVPLQWVRYASRPPVINSVEVLEAAKTGSDELANKISLEIMKACMLTKYKAWRYEQETRMVTLYKADIETRPVFYKYNESALLGAIFGNKCSLEDIYGLARKLPSSAMIYLTKPDEDRYKLRIHSEFKASDIASKRIELEKVNMDF